MNNNSIDQVKDAARRAYELGRLRKASQALLWVIPMTVLSVYVCGRPQFSLALGALLAVASVFFWWRGGVWSRGAILGAMVGTLAALIPWTFHAFGICCVYDIERGLCVASGLLAGALVSTRAIKIKEFQKRYLIAGGVVVTFTGTLGCAVLGMGGLWGFCTGLLLVSTPILIFGYMKEVYS